MSSQPGVPNRGANRQECPKPPLWRLLAGDEEPMSSDLGILCKGERVFHVDSEIAYRIFDLAVAKKDLDST